MAHPGWETPSHGDGDLPFLSRLRAEDRGSSHTGPAKKPMAAGIRGRYLATRAATTTIDGPRLGGDGELSWPGRREPKAQKETRRSAEAETSRVHAKPDGGGTMSPKNGGPNLFSSRAVSATPRANGSACVASGPQQAADLTGSRAGDVLRALQGPDRRRNEPTIDTATRVDEEARGKQLVKELLA